MSSFDPELDDVWKRRRQMPYTREDAERMGTRDLSSWRPRPRDLPSWRRDLVPEWAPGGIYDQLVQVLKQYDRGGEFSPKWEMAMAAHADLWFVGGDMCDLLVAAAPAMPDFPLHPSEPPSTSGLVVFQKALSGIDAEASGVPVTVGAYLWGPAIWRDRDVLGITAYGPSIFPGVSLAPPWLHPLGALIWPLGELADTELTSDPTVNASMAEDRRRIRALWTLSAQPDLTRSERHEPVVRNKHKARRIAQGRAVAPEAVRVVYLRHQPPRTPTKDAGRTHKHRWAVSGHWRNQAYGPGWKLHRPVYINPYLKGPENAPLVVKEKVKAWIR